MLPPAGPPAQWSSASQLRSIHLRQLTLASGGALPATWHTLPELLDIELDGVTGLSGGLPADWQTGLPQLQSLRLVNLAGAGLAFDQLLPLVNAPHRASAASGGLRSITLEGLGLEGSIPDALVTNTRQVRGPLHACACRLPIRRLHAGLICDAPNSTLSGLWPV